VISLANISEVAVTLPPRVLVHGQEGVGKTSLAAKFPNPVFVQTEDGIPAGLKIQSFGLLSTYAEVRDALAALGNEPHDFQTIVIDSVDKLEGLVWVDVCASNRWASIEAPGYGKGYVIADRWWRDLLAGLDWLRRKRGLTVVLLAHSAIETVNDPRAPAYTSYQLRLHKRARGLIADEMDLITFLATDVHVVSEDAGFSKKRTRADGGAARYLHCEGRPAFLAKSRFDLPAKIPCPRDFDVSASLAPIFPLSRRESLSLRDHNRGVYVNE
jgi:AAA domain